MLTAVLGWVLALMILGSMVWLHEAGHYLAARLLRIKVIQFAIGFGPHYLLYQNKEGTRFTLGLIPLGGFVRFLSRREPPVNDLQIHEPPVNDKETFEAQPRLNRLVVMCAGPFFNLLGAWVLFTLASAFLQFDLGTRVAFVLPGSPAEALGLQAGDRLSALDGLPLNRIDTLQQHLHDASPKRSHELRFIRDGQPHTKTLPPQDAPALKLGLIFDSSEQNRLDRPWRLSRVLSEGLSSFTAGARAFFGFLGSFFHSSEGLKEVHGPVGVLSAIQGALGSGLGLACFMLAFLSLQLGLLNLLPLPLFDGGRVTLIILEILRGKPLSQAWEEKISYIGLFLIIALVALGSFNDF